MIRTALIAVGLTLVGATLAQAAEEPRRERADRRADRIEKRFAKLDVDGDKVLGRAESEAPRLKRFARLDANGDDVIDSTEIAAFRERLEKRAARAGGALKADGAAKPARAAKRRGVIEAADRDKDGKVTKAEFMEVGARWFARADADGDERVTKAELDAFVQKIHSRADRKGASGAQ